MRESQFQHELIRDIKEMFPGCIVLKNDACYIQGIPDLLILWGERWAMLECKASVSSSRRPNQEYYVEKANDMSFADFIYPENRDEVLDDMREFFNFKNSRNFHRV